MAAAQLNSPVPELSVSEWVQGEPCHFPDLLGKVVLIEVFQVNCPGCFLYALPQAVNLYHAYQAQGLAVFGVATAFEDFDKNTLGNLKLLAERGQVIGETLHALNKQGQLIDGGLGFEIPFPLGMDKLTKTPRPVTDAEVLAFIDRQVANFAGHPEAHRNQIIRQVRSYLEALEYRAETFTTFNLKGTPSHILVDKKGILRACNFGYYPDLERDIVSLLNS